MNGLKYRDRKVGGRSWKGGKKSGMWGEGKWKVKEEEWKVGEGEWRGGKDNGRWGEGECKVGMGGRTP